MNMHDVIIRPVVTEKSSRLLQEENKLVLRVHKEATKGQVREAVEKLLGVSVGGVRVMRVSSKPKRVGRTVGRKSSYKKAIVQLTGDEAFDFFALEETDEA